MKELHSLQGKVIDSQAVRGYTIIEVTIIYKKEMYDENTRNH